MERSDKETEGLMTVPQVADYLGYSPHTIYGKVSKGEIPHVKLGRAVRFRRAEIDAWVDRQSKETEAA